MTQLWFYAEKAAELMQDVGMTAAQLNHLSVSALFSKEGGREYQEVMNKWQTKRSQ